MNCKTFLNHWDTFLFKIVDILKCNYSNTFKLFLIKISREFLFWKFLKLNYRINPRT